MNTELLGVSKDEKYVFTNKGFYVCENEGFYVPYNESMLPYLVQIAKDNNDFEFNSGEITLKEYLSKPRKILTIISEIFSPQQSLRLVKEWEENFGKKTIITESINTKTAKQIVSESFDGLRTLISEQNVDATALDITTKLVDALSKTFNDDEEEALKQIKRINNKELLDKVNQQLKKKKNMDIKAYINDEMSDIDWEYKAIYDHLKTLDATLSSGYKSNKFLRATGKVVDAGAKVGGIVLSGLSAAAKKIILPILKKGVIPLLRWIRRNAYTTIGIVVDVATALLPITTGINKAIWGLIVILDLYEIVSGESDPKDPERNANPYMFLIIDLIAWLFAAAAGQSTKAALKTAGKVTTTSATGKLLQGLIEKLPGLKNGLSRVGAYLAEKMPGINKVIQTVFNGLNKVISGVETFIKQLFSKKGVVAVGSGLAIAWFFKERNLKVGDSGNDIAGVNQYFSEYHNTMWPDCKIDDNIVNSLKNDGNKFTKNTETAVKTFEGCISKNPQYKGVIEKVDGEINNYELALYTNVEMDDRGLVTKYIPHSVKSAFSNTIGNVMKTLSKGAEKVLSPISNKQTKV
jgi:hypothetical protein